MELTHPLLITPPDAFLTAPDGSPDGLTGKSYPPPPHSLGDNYIRDAEQEPRTIQYIESNPIKTRFVLQPAEWPWSSARFREQNGVLRIPPLIPALPPETERAYRTERAVPERGLSSPQPSTIRPELPLKSIHSEIRPLLRTGKSALRLSVPPFRVFGVFRG